MADLVLRIDNLEDCAKETKSTLDEVQDRLDTHSECIRSIDQWRKGNGAQGSEARLQCVENATYDLQSVRVSERLNLMEADIVALQRIADGKISDAVSASMRATMDARDRTAIAYIKAFAPWVAAIAAIVATIVAGLK
jgi:hypothetical protein